MTEIELIGYITKLETRTGFEKKLSKKQIEEWTRRFCDYSFEDFGRAIEHITRTRERFPQLSTVYSALKEVGAGSPGKHDLIPSRPWCIYIEPDGHTSVWANRTGQSFGNDSLADDAPESFKTRNGTMARLFRVAGQDDSSRWQVYMDYRAKRDRSLGDRPLEGAVGEKMELLEGVK